MSPESSSEPVERFEHLARLLDRAVSDPSMLLAWEFLGDARASVATGDMTSAQRSVALAEMALRFGGHTVPGAPVFAAGSSGPTAEPPPEPPTPPSGRPSERR
ncbi:MAG: hypothetical protein ACREC5_00405 [Thermoplasmata archaeon]